MTDNGYASLLAQINAALPAANPAPVHVEGATVLSATRGWTVVRFEVDAPGSLRARHSSWQGDDAWVWLDTTMFVTLLVELRHRSTVIKFTTPDDAIIEIEPEPLAAGLNAAVPQWLPMVTASVWSELEPAHQVHLHNLFAKHGVEAPR